MSHRTIPRSGADPELVFAQHRLGEARLAYRSAMRALEDARGELLAADAAARRAESRAAQHTGAVEAWRESSSVLAAVRLPR